MEEEPIPSADPRLTAILNKLLAFDHAIETHEFENALEDFHADIIEDVRFLVTQLWNVHHLRRDSEWALEVIQGYHGKCYGCRVCDCESILEQQIADTEVIAVWHLRPDIDASFQREDNLLVF